MVLIAGCAKEPDPATRTEPTIFADTIRFPVEAPGAMRLLTAPVVDAQDVALSFPARLTWDEDHTSRVIPPVAGRITQIAVTPGDVVKVNQPLAYLASAELGSAQAEAARAKVDVAQALRTTARTKELAEAGIVAGKDLEQAQNDLARARAEATRTALRLRSLGAASTVDQRFALRSPIAGVVVERNLNPGMEWRPDQPSTPLFVVSDPTFLWCWIDAPERAAGIFRVGQKVNIRASAWPQEKFEAQIDHVSDALDPLSRTLKIRAHMRNLERHLKAEMYVSAELARKPESGLDVPASAVFLEEGAQRIFVKTGPAQFSRKTIAGGASGRGLVTVVDGLNRGDEVVIDGALYLQKLLDTAHRPAK